MTQFEYETERDRIDLTYAEKMQQHETQMRILQEREIDLQKQLADNMSEQLRIQGLLGVFKIRRQQELLDLKDEYIKSQNDGK